MQEGETSVDGAFRLTWASWVERSVSMLYDSMLLIMLETSIGTLSYKSYLPFNHVSVNSISYSLCFYKSVMNFYNEPCLQRSGEQSQLPRSILPAQVLHS